MLVNAYSCHVMEKSVSCCRVHGSRRVFSNPVTLNLASPTKISASTITCYTVRTRCYVCGSHDSSRDITIDDDDNQQLMYLMMYNYIYDSFLMMTKGHNISILYSHITSEHNATHLIQLSIYTYTS